MVLRLQRMYIDCNKNECRVEHLRVHGVKISPLRGESRKENLFEATLLLESSSSRGEENQASFLSKQRVFLSEKRAF
jgi:hypothetical protein